ncbi:MAG: adenosylcobinamide amidohydrolase [Pseudomonadota bacterium]
MKPKKSIFFCGILFVLFLNAAQVFPYPVSFTDAQGNHITIKQKPVRVVSLVPSTTEIIFRLGAGDAVKAITHHSSYPSETSGKSIIGGFFSPSLNRIEEMAPDVIFVSRIHKKVMERFGHGKCQLINLETDSIADAYKNIMLLGKIFGKEDAAAALVDKNKEELRIIERKVSTIPHSERKRVIRLMGRDQIMTPGDDSFQNDFIRAAGGIPPKLNKKGQVVAVTKEEWVKFNPQIIYGCGGDREASNKLFNRPGWKDVEAVKTGKIFYFPCDLTCRASTNIGYFVSWLSSRIYEDAYSKQENQVLEEQVFTSRGLSIDLDYVKDVRIAYSHVYDFINKTLIIDFKEPLAVLSTLEGQRDGIVSVGNHYSSPSCWGIGHKYGLKDIKTRVYQVVDRSEETASFLFTGADMDNLSITRRRFSDMEVYALVTAGVRSNALRMSRDQGNYYEPGTINIILLTNMALTPRAMTRAVITATEAKTAALMDLDIRSSYGATIYRATGTGTDNVIVVRGTGTRIDNAGGHTKMGELIAKAVYEGVQEAVYKQNGLTVSRNIFQRLKERKISIFGLISEKECDCDLHGNDLVGALEEILLEPRYAGFIESSFSVSDDYEKGLFADIGAYELWCKEIAEEIAGRDIETMQNLVGHDDIPIVLRMALNALLNGVYLKGMS